MFGMMEFAIEPRVPFETWIRPMAERMQWWNLKASKHDPTRDREWISRLIGCYMLTITLKVSYSLCASRIE